MIRVLAVVVFFSSSRVVTVIHKFGIIFDTRARAPQCWQQSTYLIGCSISPSVSPISETPDKISVQPIKLFDLPQISDGLER